MSGYSFLRGVRVLEFAQFASDSLGGLLADFGADVVKVEPPGTGDPVRHLGEWAIGGPAGPSFNHLRWNRGKRGIVLDLRSPEGRQAWLDLAARAHVVIEGMRAGALDRLGLGYEVLRQRAPRLIFCSLSGLGASGPYHTLGSHGHLYDAYSALLEPEFDSDGAVHRPQRRAVEVGIHAAGLYAAVGVLSALRQAELTGEGAKLEVANCDAASAWLPGRVEVELNRARICIRADQSRDGTIGGWPRVEFYRCADGKLISLQAMEVRFWANFCAECGRPDLAGEPASDDPAVKSALWAELSAIFASRTRAEWLSTFVSADIAGGPVNSLTELAADPHFLARSNVYESTVDGTPGVRMIASPVHVDGHAFSPEPPPALGGDQSAVLRDWLWTGCRDAAGERPAEPPGDLTSRRSPS
jgi:crotonobetainyl-CoA:carnitine CoA-transferase CaiB-like acyl-CoA transferase